MLSSQNIFLVKNRALGDSVMGLASVQYLRDLYPKANIVYGVPQWVWPLYKEIQTAANVIYPVALNSVSDFFKTYQALKRLKIDSIHEMHQSGRGAKLFKLLAFFLGVPYSFHNHHEKKAGKVLDQGIIKPLIQRDLDGVYSFFGKNKEVPHYLNFHPHFIFPNEIKKKAILIFGVVGARETKMWPLENFLKLAEIINNKFPAFKIIIPLSSSSVDKQIKKKILALGPGPNIEIQEWGLDSLAAHFREAAFYFGNDTGLKHIAVASGIKTFTIFGPEPFHEWHPYDCKAHPFFYLEELLCRTRNGHYCGLSVCDLKTEKMKCMNIFSAEEAAEKIHSTCKDFLQSHGL